MKKRIFVRTILISLISILTFAICSSFILYNSDKQRQTEKLALFLQTVLSNSVIDSDNYQSSVNQIQSIYGDPLRITLINSEGTVLADTQVDSANLENHANREEIVHALLFGEGSSVRYSSTLGENELYYATQTKDGLILRAMLPISTIWSNFFHLMPYILLSALIALLISVFTSKKMASGALHPLTEIADGLTKIGQEDFSKKIPYSEFDELNPLIKSVNQLSIKIDSSLNEIKQEKDKLNYILNNISQGVILLDEEYHIVHCNKAADNIFGIGEGTPTTLFDLTRNTNLIKAVEKAQQYETTRFELNADNDQKVFSVAVMPNHSLLYEKNIFIILTDITQSKYNENMRKEFFSNASHELRTPITSIMGFAELMSSHPNQSLDDMKQYADVIYKESEKLSALLEDILKISSLEESGKTTISKPLDINKELRELMNFPSIQMNEKNICIHLNLHQEPLTLIMDESDFTSMIINLTENALKYGKPDGNIWIETNTDRRKITISIKDDGIGIHKADMDRIFERFYRADKSRNNKIKGTGLGLAIVKHIVLKYNGEIEVDSEYGKGTTFTISFSR